MNDPSPKAKRLRLTLVKNIYTLEINERDEVKIISFASYKKKL